MNRFRLVCIAAALALWIPPAAAAQTSTPGSLAPAPTLPPARRPPGSERRMDPDDAR
jgi:hypothetical protein